MNVSSSLQNSFMTTLLQSQSLYSNTTFGDTLLSKDADGDNDNDSAENAQKKQQENYSSSLNTQSIFSTLNQNGDQGISTEQLLNALSTQPSSYNKTQEDKSFQNILMQTSASSYSDNSTNQRNQVLSA